ncbi:hypothetical protein [Halorubrum depositum]|uniref:hypothetical protein n=1 Tax=Halorubrum depositum TaxID=2583992 RepID=UPI001F4F9D9A|nr:hypothetical protein [Halorubrum depositum]
MALIVGLLVATAGCAGLPGGDAGTAAPDSAGEGAAETADSNTTNTTGTSETTTESNESDGHSHSHENESDSNASTSIEAEHTGEMAVMVGDERVDLAANADGEDAINMADRDTWYTNESVTLSEALEVADVEAAESTLTYDGETYDESTDGTKISYRVGSHEVDPEEYTLESDDKIWVLVVTDDSDVTTPGEYIPPEDLHVHGSIDFTVDGEELDFSRDKYQQAGHNDHFHFEGGHASPWHAHSAHVTVGYAMSTLEGINVSDDAITYNGTAYAFDGEDGAATVKVNGESVDPNEYYLKNGDSVTIAIEPSD